jgi:hypothetical protein
MVSRTLASLAMASLGTAGLLRNPMGSRRIAIPGRTSISAPSTAWLRIRQWIEAIFDMLKDQLNLERHGARRRHGRYARVGQRLLAMSTCIWHNTNIGAPRKRSLIAYDH